MISTDLQKRRHAIAMLHLARNHAYETQTTAALIDAVDEVLLCHPRGATTPPAPAPAIVPPLKPKAEPEPKPVSLPDTFTPAWDVEFYDAKGFLDHNASVSSFAELADMACGRQFRIMRPTQERT